MCSKVSILRACSPVIIDTGKPVETGMFKLSLAKTTGMVRMLCSVVRNSRDNPDLGNEGVGDSLFDFSCWNGHESFEIMTPSNCLFRSLTAITSF